MMCVCICTYFCYFWYILRIYALDFVWYFLYKIFKVMHWNDSSRYVGYVRYYWFDENTNWILWWYQLESVELIIIFVITPRSRITEFGCESYNQSKLERIDFATISILSQNLTPNVDWTGKFFTQKGCKVLLNHLFNCAWITSIRI